MNRRIASLVLVLLACAAWGPHAGASENVAAALVSEGASVEPGRPFHVGLRMTMRRGWHIYWKNPGDAGLPPKIAWRLPEGFAAGPFEWPAPERIAGTEATSYGYRGEVLLPVEIVPPARLAADSVTLAGRLEWLECADVCLPAASEVTLTLPVRPGTPAPSRDAPSFAEARSRLPEPPAGWTFTAEAGPRAVSLRFKSPPGTSPRGAYLFVDEPMVVDYTAPQGFERTAGGYRVTAAPAANAQGAPGHLTGVLVLEGRLGSRARTAVQVDVPVSRGDPAPAPAPGSHRPAARYLIVIAVAGLALAAFFVRSVPRKESS